MKNAELRLAMIRLLTELTAAEIEQIYAKASHEAIKETTKNAVKLAIIKEKQAEEE